MDINVFNSTSFGKGDKCVYMGETYLIAALDFQEKLIGLINDPPGTGDEIFWVRCESVSEITMSKI